jgi:hypothetical protein
LRDDQQTNKDERRDIPHSILLTHVFRGLFCTPQFVGFFFQRWFGLIAFLHRSAASQY